MKRTVCILAIVWLCISAFGQSAQQNRKAKLEKEISQLERQIKRADSKKNNALVALDLLGKKTAARKKLVAESEREVRSLNDSIYLCQKQINLIQARLDTMTVYYDRLVRNAYKNRDSRVWYMYILSSSGIGQGVRRYGYLRTLSAQMNSQAGKIMESKAEMERHMADMRRLREKARKVKTERETELSKLGDEQAQNRKLVARLQKEKSKYTTELESKKSQVEALDKQIKALIAQSSKSSKNKKEKKPVDIKLSSDFESNRGKLPWPVEGPVVGTFGQHNHPVYRNVKLPFNNGINIAADEGTPVKAVFNGTVRNVIIMPGYGKCVLVQHGDYFTFYCKLMNIKVKSGSQVKTGQVIGEVDTIDGQSQVHFQLWNGSKAQNPEVWLR